MCDCAQLEPYVRDVLHPGGDDSSMFVCDCVHLEPCARDVLHSGWKDSILALISIDFRNWKCANAVNRIHVIELGFT